MPRLVAILAALLQTSSLPPAYPRVGTTNLLDNDRVQVWNIAWLKGQPSPPHRHVYDLVGVYYEPGDRVISSPNGAKRPVTTKAWDIAFQLKGVTHIEEGTSDAPLRAVFVEMKQDAYGSISSILQTGDTPTFAAVAERMGARPRLDNTRVTVWDYTSPEAAAGDTPTDRYRHTHALDAVVVSFDGSMPHASYVARGTTHDDDGPGRVFIFELK